MILSRTGFEGGAIHHGRYFESEAILVPLTTQIQFIAEGDLVKVIRRREDVSELRKEETGMAASKVAALIAFVKLLRRQRALYAAPVEVADGRDMGTVVFVEAEENIFRCSAEERANRLKTVATGAVRC